MKTEYYLNDDGKTDHIDECAATYTPEEFRGAMRFTIDKYKKRMGKKDDIELEKGKIADYEKRWAEYEQKIKAKSDEEMRNRNR